MRVGDLQQIMLQTDSVGKVQQQGSHSAEVEQSKLASQHLIKEKDKKKQIQTAEDTVFIKDRDAHQQQAQSDQDESESETEAGAESQTNNSAQPLKMTGKHIDITV